MKKFLALLGLSALALIPSALGAGSFDVHKVSETATTVTLGWDAQPGADGYRFYADGVAVSRTFDPSRTTVRFGKQFATYKVAALQVTETGTVGVYPAPVEPPTPPATTITGAECDRRAAVAGTVIENVTVTGGCEVTAQNVTLLNAALGGAVVFEPSASGGKLLGSHVTGAHIFGADNILIDGSTVDCEGLSKDGSIIWDDPAGNYPQNITIRNSTYRNCKDVKPDDHSQAIYLGYSRDVLIENNTFTNNGSTSHIFVTWFGNQADPATTYPRNVCIRGNTFGPTAGAYYDFNYRQEIPVSANIKVQRDASGGGPFYGDC